MHVRNHYPRPVPGVNRVAGRSRRTLCPAIAVGLVVSPVATAKNKPCLDFMARAGMPKADSDYVPPALADEPSPPLVAIEGLE